MIFVWQNFWKELDQNYPSGAKDLAANKKMLQSTTVPEFISMLRFGKGGGEKKEDRKSATSWMGMDSFEQQNDTHYDWHFLCTTISPEDHLL